MVLLRRGLAARLSGPAALLDAVVAVVAYVGLIVADNRGGLRHVSHATMLIRELGILLAAAAIVARRNSPRRALLAATLGSLLATSLGGTPQVSICVALIAYTVASTADFQPWWPVLAAVTFVIAAGVAIGQVPDWLTALVPSLAVVAVGWSAGQVRKEQRARVMALAGRREEQERQRAADLRQAAADERFVIARELHDIVAHSMSVIAVRAGVARMVMDNDPAEVREALTIIETSTRRALTEMRLLVAVLREEHADSALAPAPGLTDLAALTGQITMAGVEVELDVLGPVRALPPGVDLSAYRIAQEALTNVVRHAGPTKATLRIEYLPEELLIEVIDTGPAPGRVVAADGRVGTGHGLIGMGERVALFDGELRTGRVGAGFQVHALLRAEPLQ